MGKARALKEINEINKLRKVYNEALKLVESNVLDMKQEKKINI